MKLKVIAAAAAALAAGSAYALPPTATPAVIVYAGGGSAQPNAFMWAANQLLNNIDSYTDGACGAQSGNYRIFFGSTKNQLTATGGATVPAGTNVLVYYKLSGGSFPNGVASQGNGSQLPYPPISTATLCAGQDPPSFGVGNVLPQYAIPSGFTATNQVPDFGLSDTEVSLFNFTDNVPSALAANVLTAAQVKNIKQDGIYDNIVGMAVTGSVFNAAHPKTNFTAAEVQGIMGGQFIDWSQMTADDGTVMPAGPIVLLDRSPGSGTKAAINEFFLNYPGGLALGGAWGPANIVFGATGSLCNGSYADINESSSTNLVNDLNTADQTAGCRAVGILGLEFPPQLNEAGTPLAQHYWFTKINGVDPGVNGAAATYANEINGSYPYFFTNSFNNRTAQVGANPQHWEGDGSMNSTLITNFRTTLQSPQMPGGVASQPLPNGVPGLLSDPLITGGFTIGCTTRGSHQKNTVLPIQIDEDYKSFPATPACNDPL